MSVKYEKPIFIIGAPRSGTSLFQKIVRSHPSVWSLPSESDMIWDRFCHPSLRGWESEVMRAADVTDEAKHVIQRMYAEYTMPASFWRKIEKTNIIWASKRNRSLRLFFKPLYRKFFPLLQRLSVKPNVEKRLLDKTASNCFRLAYINEIFPDAKIIYPTRDGRSSVNSLINGWKNPDRFFTYKVPISLNIEGYEHQGWKFMLPPGWEKYKASTIEEVCAFQWVACHKAMQAEICKPKYTGRVKIVKLEDLIKSPIAQITQLLEFVELDVSLFPMKALETLPIVNSPDNIASPEKWKNQNKALVERVFPKIEKMMTILEYLEES